MEAAVTEETTTTTARDSWDRLLADLDLEDGACGYFHAPRSMSCDGCPIHGDEGCSASCDVELARDVARRIRRLRARDRVERRWEIARVKAGARTLGA